MLPMYPAAPVTRIFKSASPLRKLVRYRLHDYTQTSVHNLGDDIKKIIAMRKHRRCALGLRQTALECKQDQVCAASHTKFAEQIGNVEFHSTFGDVQLAGDLFIGEIFEQGIENFLLATAKVRNRFGLQP